MGDMLKGTLDWLQLILDLGWNLMDQAIITTAGRNRREARAGREQATPYTHTIVGMLLNAHAKAEGP